MEFSEYSLSDRLSAIQYPSKRWVHYVPDSIGRIASVQNPAAQPAYATIDSTAPNGIPKMTMGNDIVEQTSWNDRFQITGVTAGKPPAAAALSLGSRIVPNWLRFAPRGTTERCAHRQSGLLR